MVPCSTSRHCRSPLEDYSEARSSARRGAFVASFSRLWRWSKLSKPQIRRWSSAISQSCIAGLPRLSPRYWTTRAPGPTVRFVPVARTLPASRGPSAPGEAYAIPPPGGRTARIEAGSPSRAGVGRHLGRMNPAHLLASSPESPREKRWEGRFPPLGAGGGHELPVEDGKPRLTVPLEFAVGRLPVPVHGGKPESFAIEASGLLEVLSHKLNAVESEPCRVMAGPCAADFGR
jgi:hypothetical protein